jgi:L-seryl-tRNA(Ser) seleniumtransferase
MPPAMTYAVNSGSILARLGVRPVINASGIYTDLGGSQLDAEVWAAATEANATWVSLPELLDRTGERAAELCGAPAGRVVPGASAAIALATAACIARGDGEVSERLPEIARRTPNGVVLQVVHRYKYARCAVLGGGHLIEAGSTSGTDEGELASALGRDVVAVLHPGHLDSAPGALGLGDVARVAHEHGVPVIVDAAYLSYPVELIGSFGAAGADLVCFSAKYFHGPNAGGLLIGREDLLDAVRAVDFTQYESGRWLNFGRALKMDRATVVATVLALERWLARDHGERWAGYRRRADALVEELGSLSGVHARSAQFTLDERIVHEPPNSLVLRVSGALGLSAGDIERRLAQGDPSIACLAQADELVFCLETVAEHEDAQLLGRIREVLGGQA